MVASAQRIWQDLAETRAFEGSYESVKRFVRQLEEEQELPFRRLEALVEVVGRLVRAEVFLPSEQSFACGDCPYGEACAAWHRGRARVSVGFGRAAWWSSVRPKRRPCKATGVAQGFRHPGQHGAICP